MFKEYSSVCGDRPKRKDFKEISILNLEYGENSKTLGNEIKTHRKLHCKFHPFHSKTREKSHIL